MNPDSGADGGRAQPEHTDPVVRAAETRAALHPDLETLCGPTGVKPLTL